MQQCINITAESPINPYWSFADFIEGLLRYVLKLWTQADRIIEDRETRSIRGYESVSACQRQKHCACLITSKTDLGLEDQGTEIL